jgi:hypothetical protein
VTRSPPGKDETSARKLSSMAGAYMADPPLRAQLASADETLTTRQAGTRRVRLDSMAKGT